MMSLEEAVKLLKVAVKQSNVKNQPHIDLSLVDSRDHIKYKQALMVAQSKVLKGEMKKEELLALLGL